MVGRDGRIAYKLVGPINARQSGNDAEAADREGAGDAPLSTEKFAERFRESIQIRLQQRGLDRTLGRFDQEFMSAVTFEADIE